MNRLFCERPKGFNTVDMAFAIGTFVVPMFYSIMLFITQIHMTIVTLAAVRMNQTVRDYLTTNDGLQSGFGALGYDYCKPCHLVEGCRKQEFFHWAHDRTSPLCAYHRSKMYQLQYCSEREILVQKTLQSFRG
jgi:hypothetical protein